MNEQRIFLALCCLLMPVPEANASGNSALDLSADAPSCKNTASTRPKLQAELGPESKEAIRTGWYSPLKADFNGDGWCDFAWAIPYPVNSKMASYFLDEVMSLGGPKGWRMPFKGKGPPIFDVDLHIWRTQNVAMTEIAMAYPKAGGAPYILGLGPDGMKSLGWGCREYISVHRWGNEVDAFKQVDDATRDAVINFYYAHIGQRCERPSEPRKP